MWILYIIESLQNKRRYTGITSNLKRRLTEHSANIKSSSYTSKNGPFKLIYIEGYLNKKDATEAERFFKSGYGREVLKEKLKNYLENK